MYKNSTMITIYFCLLCLFYTKIVICAKMATLLQSGFFMPNGYFPQKNGFFCTTVDISRQSGYFSIIPASESFIQNNLYKNSTMITLYFLSLFCSMDPNSSKLSTPSPSLSNLLKTAST